MGYVSTLISVRDMQKTIDFYRKILGLEVIQDFGSNKTLTGGISLQTEESWRGFIENRSVSYGGNQVELYFEEDDFDGFLERLETTHGIEYVHPVKEHSWGQRAVRIYDPDKHIIEVGENLDYVCKRFQDAGMTLEQIADRMDIPLDFAKECLTRVKDGEK